MDITVVGLTNLALCVGFAYIAFALLPRFQIKDNLVKISGTAFFVIGAALRVPIVLSTFVGWEVDSSLTSGYLSMLQLVMAFLVWFWIWGLHKQKKHGEVEFSSLSTDELRNEVVRLQKEVFDKDAQLGSYQRERFTRSLSEMQTRVEELNAIVRQTKGNV